MGAEQGTSRTGPAKAPAPAERGPSARGRTVGGRLARGVRCRQLRRDPRVPRQRRVVGSQLDSARIGRPGGAELLPHHVHVPQARVGRPIGRVYRQGPLVERRRLLGTLGPQVQVAQVVQGLDEGRVARQRLLVRRRRLGVLAPLCIQQAQPEADLRIVRIGVEGVEQLVQASVLRFQPARPLQRLESLLAASGAQVGVAQAESGLAQLGPQAHRPLDIG